MDVDPVGVGYNTPEDVLLSISLPEDILPEYTSFDVAETYVYKLAHHWRVRLREVVVINSMSFHPEFLNAVEFVNVRLSQDKSLETINKELTKVAKRRMSDIVLKTAIYEFINFLSPLMQNIMKAPTYPQKYATEVDRMLTRMSVYSRLLRGGDVTFESARASYKQHEEAYAIEMKKIDDIAAKIHETHALYSWVIEQDVMRVSDLAMLTEHIRLIVEEDLTSEDTISQFDNLQATRNIRHSVCVTHVDVYQKIYVPGPFEHLGEQQLINTTQLPLNSITFTVTASETYQFTYYVGAGYIEGTVKSYDKETVIDLIRSFTHLHLIEEVVNLKCQVRLYPRTPNKFDLMMHYLLHMTVVDPSVYQMHMDESTDPYQTKKKYIMRYRAAWRVNDVGFLPSKKKEVEAMASISCPETLSKTNYIAINIECFSMLSVFRYLASLLPTLCLYYNDHILNTSPLYDLYNIPNLNIERTAPSGKADVAKHLHDEWPQVFTSEYLASDKGSKHLVITTTSPLDRDLWQKEVLVDNNNREFYRDVKAFPPTGPTMFWYTFVSMDAHFVGLVPNTADVAPLYPEVPASFVSASGPRQTMGSGTGKSVSLKALRKAGKEGVAPEAINVVVGRDVKRTGVPGGPDNFILAVMSAMSNRDPLDVVKRDLFKLHPEVYKQQFYDLSLDEIASRVENEREYFDPLLYAAGLEAMYNCDIYVITPETVKNVTTHAISLPRHREFYCRYNRHRRCVIIYNNPGEKADKLRHPHCELITDARSHAKIFNEDVSARLHSIMMMSNTYLHSLPYSLETSNCMSSRLLEVLRGAELVSQMIDDYGKMRAVTVTVKDVTVTLFCFPASPLNCKESKEIYTCDMGWFERFCGSRITGRSNIGVWATHGATEEVLYVRTHDAPDNRIVFIGQDPMMLDNFVAVDDMRSNIDNSNSKVDFIQLSTSRDRMATVLRESLKWYLEAFSLYRGSIDVDAFVAECLSYLDPPMNEDEYYTNISTVKDMLPAVASLDDVTAYISEFVPEIIGGVVYLHDAAYYDCMVYTLKRHANAFVLSPDIVERRRIPGFYSSLYDFRQYPNTLIIAGKSTNTYTKAQKQSSMSSVPQIVNELRLGLLGSANPIVYNDGVVYYLIQATQTGSFGAAYTICDAWSETQRNVGYMATATLETPVPVVVYEIDNNMMKPVAYLLGNEQVDRIEGDMFFEMIVSESKYYAVLRLV